MAGETLVEAVDQGVLSETGGGFGFRHALASRTAYENLNPARRMALHGRLLAAVLRDAGLPPERHATLAVALGWAALDTLHAREITGPLRGEPRFLLAAILGQAGEDPALQRQLFLGQGRRVRHLPGQATDAAGNAIDQTITRAWKVSQR